MGTGVYSTPPSVLTKEGGTHTSAWPVYTPCVPRLAASRDGEGTGGRAGGGAQDASLPLLLCVLVFFFFFGTRNKCSEINI